LLFPNPVCAIGSYKVMSVCGALSTWRSENKNPQAAAIGINLLQPTQRGTSTELLRDTSLDRLIRTGTTMSGGPAEKALNPFKAFALFRDPASGAVGLTILDGQCKTFHLPRFVFDEAYCY